MSAPRVGIVGGGILGTGLALRLAQQGADVTLLERGSSLGGLAGAMDFGGHTVDRFYHVITPADSHMLEMAEEVGLGDQVEFRPVGAGFFIDGELHDFDGVGDLLRFSPLSPLARMRLGWFVAQCQLRSGFSRLDELPLERWLRRHCGREVVERIWKPLLDSRFDSDPAGLPATYLWARTRRMSGARKGGSGAEEMGHVIGGHQRLIDAMAERAVELGVTPMVNAPVEGLALANGSVEGVMVGGEVLPFDLTIATLQPPALRFLLPSSMQSLLEPYPQRWLGVVCLVLKVRRSLSPYYAVNICEPTPITTVVEASHAVGTDHTDGLRLLYLPKYCDPAAPEQSEDDRSIYERFTAQLRRIAPDFTDDDVVDWTVQRAKLVEPVHGLGAGRTIPPVFPSVPGLALASNAQIYPFLLNGDSVLRFAEDVAAQTAERLSLPGRPALPAQPAVQRLAA
ncbi:MAG TPA: FAD-dependent oxidoreductase [Thermoleophilaceae bacterium]|jgi:protoporphyrinogen oxidase